MKVDWSLYLITDRRAAGERSLVDVVHAAIQGGATAVQLRDKTAFIRETLEIGWALRQLTREAGIPLIVNDRVDVALALDADGVHVGQDDMPAELVRGLIGPNRILGVSAATVEEAQQAEHAGADYLGVGDVFGTPSKLDAGEPIGLKNLSRITRAVSIPVVGIGGITAENTESIIEAGAIGVAVISAVIGRPDPKAAAQVLRQALNLKKEY